MDYIINLEDRIIVTGIVCKKCFIELPPMLESEHLDIDNPKNIMCACYDEEEIENKMMEYYVKLNPYPSYDEMIEKIIDKLDLYAEYGEFNHICCKIIYENPTNKDLIIKMGKKIYCRGGMTALQANCYTITNFSPFYKSTDIRIKSFGRLVEFYFQDVCDEWKA